MKKLNELTLKDNWMFGAVMLQDDNCKQFLERLLGFEIETLIIDTEKSIIYHPEYKGIRMDVIAKDEKIKSSREMGRRYMWLEEMLEEVTDGIKDSLEQQEDLLSLKRLFEAALSVNSIEEFRCEMRKLC